MGTFLVRAPLIMLAIGLFVLCALGIYSAREELKDGSMFLGVLLVIISFLATGFGSLLIFMAFWLTQPAMI